MFPDEDACGAIQLVISSSGPLVVKHICMMRPLICVHNVFEISHSLLYINDTRWCYTIPCFLMSLCGSFLFVYPFGIAPVAAPLLSVFILGFQWRLKQTRLFCPTCSSVKSVP